MNHAWSLLTHSWFTKTSIILFLNKIDLFRAKLGKSPLSETFPDYTGGANYEAACAFLLEKFVGLNKNPSKSIYAVSASFGSCLVHHLSAALYRCDRHEGSFIRHLCD
jgi:guanine nucleotide-binding protein subunit alpha